MKARIELLDIIERWAVNEMGGSPDTGSMARVVYVDLEPEIDPWCGRTFRLPLAPLADAILEAVKAGKLKGITDATITARPTEVVRNMQVLPQEAG
jgi:hypothetical protein